jgi:predicted DNA-binding ribbon-helix-helix protein
MSTLTIRLPEDKHARIRQLAKHREMSVNKLFEELATISLAEFDAESRFRVVAARGSAKKGLSLLSKLDNAFAAGA